MPHALPPPLKLLTRVLVVGTVLLGLAFIGRRAMIEPLLPLISGSVAWVDSDFQVLSADIASEGLNEILSVRANLNSPIVVGARAVYPFGWENQYPSGWYQAALSLGSIPASALLLLTLVLAWPAERPSVYLVRLAMALPLAGLLLFLYIPFTVDAQFWQPLHNVLEPYAFSPILAWNFFVLGGGGFVMAGAMALMIIRVTAHAAAVASGDT